MATTVWLSVPSPGWATIGKLLPVAMLNFLPWCLLQFAFPFLSTTLNQTRR